jgi:hypothetical protein
MSSGFGAGNQMSGKSEPDVMISESAPRWAGPWRQCVESSKQITDAWSSSMALLMLAGESQGKLSRSIADRLIARDATSEA